MYYILFSSPPNILVSLDKAFCSGAVTYWIYAILQMWCVVLFIRQDMYFLQKNTELFRYEEPFKITTVTKKIADYLLFIHISLTDCTVHFYLHLYTSTVQSYIANLKVKDFLFPIQNSGSTPQVHPLLQAKKEWGNPAQHWIISISHLKPVKPHDGRTPCRQSAEFPQLPLLKRAACCARLCCVTQHSGSWYAKWKDSSMI